jgi:acyl-coenzyme A thioesterase PaaI-like protein
MGLERATVSESGESPLRIRRSTGGNEMAVITEMKTAFLRAARGEDFRCRATVLNLGKRLIYGSGGVELGKVLAQRIILA